MKSIRLGKKPRALEWLLNNSHDHTGSHWDPKSWEKMMRLRGPMITEAVQQGCVAIWQSCGAGSSDLSTFHLVPVLAGLQHLWQTGQCRFHEWTAADAAKATQYAIQEMGGFSDWLPELAKAHPQPVIEVIEGRIEQVWAMSEKSGGIRMVERLHWSKSGLARLLAPAVMRRFQAGDPPSHEGLKSVIHLLMAHSRTSHEEFAALAAQRILLYEVEAPQHHLWLMIWIQTHTAEALNYFERLVSENAFTEEGATHEVVKICAGLDDSFGRKELISSPDYAQPQIAESFIRWVYRWVRPDADIRRRSGSYTPTPRDDAQRFRGRLLSQLAEKDSAEAEWAMLSLLDAPELQNDRDYLLHLHERQSRRIADGLPWHENSIRTFQSQHVAVPLSVADLYAMACRRLFQIKRMVEKPFEHAVGGYVRQDSNEADVRRFLAMKLSELSRGIYTAPQEAVIQGELRPDLRLESPSIQGAVPIEVKIADERSANCLMADLEGQLVGDYLSNYSSRHGVFVVGLVGRRPNGWQHPTTREMLDFDQLIELLRQRALELLTEKEQALGLEVIGMDFRQSGSSRN